MSILCHFGFHDKGVARKHYDVDGNIDWVRYHCRELGCDWTEKVEHES